MQPDYFLSDHSVPEDTAWIGALIREAGTISRSELGRQAGLSRTALTSRLEALLSMGLIEEVGPGPSRGGRPPSRLRFAASAGHVVGVDLGARAVDVAITDLAARPLVHESETMDVCFGPEAILERICVILDRLLIEPPVDHERVRGIGIGIPAPVESGAGHSVAPQILPGWEGFDVAGFLRARYGWPVFVENDANVMALGESWCGIAQSVADFLWVKLGSGIGCGIVTNGQVFRGAHGCAGDIGHIRVGATETRCTCGGIGCLEALAGGDALARAAHELADDGRSATLRRLREEHGRLTTVEIATAVGEGDLASIELIRDTGASVGTVLAGLVNFFNPSLIVIGGEVARIGDLLLASIRESVYRLSLPLATRDLAISGTALEGLAGVIGAAALVLDARYRLVPSAGHRGARGTQIARTEALGAPASGPDAVRVR